MKQLNLFNMPVGVNPRAVNVASVPQRSPFRYPGGKTWFVPRLREWLTSQTQKPHILIEPFVGGGIISLTAVCENFVEFSLMADLDEEVAAVWQTVVLGEAAWLAERILKFEMNKKNALNILNEKSNLTRDVAFKTIIKNRCFHGGILAPGSGFIKKGECGKGILSRWYPETLAKRLMDIDLIRGKLTFKKSDAMRVLDEFQENENAVFFIDPPYTVGGKKAGKRLYSHYSLDHDLLFKKCVKLRGDFIMTYDNSNEVKMLAKKYNLQAKPIPMKNTHHAEMTELVIGKNLKWMEGMSGFLEESAMYKVGEQNHSANYLTVQG